MNPDYTIAVHDTIQIALDSNPTTGYSWKWTNKERVTIVTSDGAAYIPIQVKKGIMGSGGKEMWKFIGVKSGTDSIKLEYRRPWDTSSTIMTKIIYVKVK